ncbi:hypothetical protein [Actinoplanes sp. NPDC048796]|uniref:hypothetical protein n=1 Tax=unclassified Actinoplanes TaxID=2626549 RepID=UPI0033EE9DE1
MLALFGVGLALAVIPVIVVEAVPAARAAEMAGVSSLIRSVGSSVGTQVMAGIGAVSPAFVFGAVATLLAAIVATRIPRVNSALAAGVAAGDTVDSERTTA